MAHNIKKMLLTLLIACIAVAQVQAVPQQPQALNQAGIYQLRQTDPNLTGSGVAIAVICRSITYTNTVPQNDYRPNINHDCLKDKDFTFHDHNESTAGISSHSTAICSVLFGKDPNASDQQLGEFKFEGVVPQAEAHIYEFWHFLTDKVFTQSPPKADIITAGMGSAFADWWTRGIEAMAESAGLIVVSSVGNGADANDPLFYPGASANVIGVGVVDCPYTGQGAVDLANFSLAHPEHSSIGPTEDGRCKPDIVAPGNFLAADSCDLSGYEATGSWSSFSTPIVAGTTALLVQKANQDPNLADAVSPNGGNCVIKAILLNSATKLPYWHKGRIQKDDDHYRPLDFIQGAGMLNAVSAYRHLTSGQKKPGETSTIGWDLDRLAKNRNVENVYEITIPQPDDKFITATISWNKHYSNTYPFKQLSEKDSDLRLELWAVEPNNPKNDYLLDYSDSPADNIEHIHCRTDANYTNYELVVLVSDMNAPNNTDTAQPYGIAWNTSENRNTTENILWYDLNNDGIVDESDVSILVDNILADINNQHQQYPLGDINADGTIDIKDLNILIKHINQKAPWYKN